jgi:hypothetical protein
LYASFLRVLLVLQQALQQALQLVLQLLRLPELPQLRLLLQQPPPPWFSAFYHSL